MFCCLTAPADNPPWEGQLYRKIIIIAQNGAKNNLSVVKTRGCSWKPRWRKNNQLVSVSEKHGAHSVLDKNAVDLLWSCRRNWQLVVNLILIFHCVKRPLFY